MATDTTPPDDGPPPDPFEAELVAYLDGELDPVAARKVETRLARDPVARARAAELKKSFDLLDYLPKPEPSPTFTTRTLDKLPAIKSGPTVSAPVAAVVTTPRPAAKSGPAPVVNVSTSMAIPLEPAAAPSRSLLWGVAACVAACAFAVAGYFLTTAARPHFVSTPRDKEQPEEVSVDARVVERLPLYAVADDIVFVSELAKPDLFGDDPAVSYDVTLRVPPADAADRPTAKELETLTKAFRTLPASRQAEIIKLDRDLFAREPKDRDRLFRVLETYAVWLDALPDAERKGVLTAATPNLRLGVVRNLRDQQWLHSLPQAVRGKPEQVQLWRDDEATRRDRAAFARRHAEAFAANKSLWPFDTDAGRREVLEYARTVLKVNDPLRRRMDRFEWEEYERVLEAARRDDAWAWYGLWVYELAHRRPYLPEPADPSKMFTDANQLPDTVTRHLKKGTPFRLKPFVDKWPEFPLAIHAELQGVKGAPSTQLGPAHHTEFKKPLQDFYAKELFPKLTNDERREMESKGGKWPDYSRRFVELARKYDLPVPGVTLPFAPKRWDTIYGPSRP